MTLRIVPNKIILVIWNVPEDAEKQFPSCKALVKNIFSDFMGLNEDVEIMRAHRTTVQNHCGGTTRARPIHMALLRFTDKQYVTVHGKMYLNTYPLDGQKC